MYMKGYEGDLHTIALKIGSFAVIQPLHWSIVGVISKDHNGETGLYFAVRSGHLVYVKPLLEVRDKTDKMDLDTPR